MLEHHQKPPQLSFDEIIQSLPISQELLPLFEQDKNFLERLASQLNQSPKRKSTFGFTLAWLFGSKCLGALFLAPLIVFSLLCFMSLEQSLPPGAINFVFSMWVGFSSFICGLFACIHIYYRIRTLWMLKNGYFTLGLQIKSGVPIIYKDESGVTRLWDPSSLLDPNSRLTSDSTSQSTSDSKPKPTSDSTSQSTSDSKPKPTFNWNQMISQPSSANNDNYLNLIAVDRRNPDDILIVYMADDYRETNTDISFSFPRWFDNSSPLPVKYDLSSKTFSTTINRFGQYIPIIAGVIVVVIEIFILLLIIIAIINKCC